MLGIWIVLYGLFLMGMPVQIFYNESTVEASAILISFVIVLIPFAVGVFMLLNADWFVGRMYSVCGFLAKSNNVEEQ